MYNSVTHLQWLDLQHNYLVTLSEELNKFPNLKSLYLHVNFIADTKEFTKIMNLPVLRSLTVHGNPIDKIPNFRLYLISIFPQLKKLDTVLISKKERDNASVMKNLFKLNKLPAYTERDCPVPPDIVAKNPQKDEANNFGI